MFSRIHVNVYKQEFFTAEDAEDAEEIRWLKKKIADLRFQISDFLFSSASSASSAVNSMRERMPLEFHSGVLDSLNKFRQRILRVAVEHSCSGFEEEGVLDSCEAFALAAL